MTGEVDVFTDGACKGNPGIGGWGVLLQYGDRTRELCGGEAHTTNNRMELTAVIRALEALNRKCHAAGKQPIRNRLKTRICGGGSTTSRASMKSSGYGCAAITATTATNAPTSSPIKAAQQLTERGEAIGDRHQRHEVFPPLAFPLSPVGNLCAR
jgi:hypothetical protein